jgi:hypothetical protein
MERNWYHEQQKSLRGIVVSKFKGRFHCLCIYYAVALWGPPNLLHRGYLVVFARESSGKGEKLTIHHHYHFSIRVDGLLRN